MGLLVALGLGTNREQSRSGLRTQPSQLVILMPWRSYNLRQSSVGDRAMPSKDCC